ncbi:MULTISPECIES: outer membrane beta-barrel family protein [Flavobacteriaceae]|uniref:outer membrane beta-barrel family protein n=1 Tax=Flavobacteriaceae TaxID=49546 RepID=UPI001492F651|nr:MULTISPECIES: outer membrane beta-barrel family protein [Allomuricauda]MDC6364690.1 outer membrane beta-barrel family protein [Muricauda sp. AC10]
MKYILAFMFSMYGFLVFPQQETIIFGTVIDADTKKPIPYTTIAIFNDNLLINGVSSNEDGTFKIRVKETYTHIEVSFIGYKKSTIKASEFTDGITIHLFQDINALDEVIIKGERTTSLLKIDRKIINLGSNIQQSGVNALEAFEQIPEVETDIATGTIALRGSENIQILVNGKLSPLNTSELLQQIRASNIDRIEIITSPSAKNRADGLSGIINIILKRQRNLGLNIVSNASIGTRRYGFGIDGNYNNSWYNFKARISQSKNKTTNNQLLKREFGDGTTESIFTPYEFDGIVNNIATGIDFFIGAKQELSINVDYTDDSHDYINNSSYFNVTNRDDYEYLRQNSHKHYITIFNGNYRFSFSDNNHFLELDFNLNNSENTYPLTDSENDVELFDERLTEDFLLQSFALDYTFPLKEKVIVETGVSKNTQFLESARLFVPVSGIEENNQFEYDEVLWGMYAQSKFAVSKLSIQTGLRYEYFTSNSKSQTNNFISSMKFSNVFPSLHLSYKLKDNNTLNLGYSKRVSRPNFHHVNAFQIVSPLYIWEYNPDILPEFSDNIEFSYQTKIKNLNVNLSTFYRHRKDVILWTQTGTNNQQTFRYENAGVFNSYGLESDLSYKIASYWNSRLTANYYFTKVNQSALVTWDKLYSSTFQFKNIIKINKAISTDLTYIYRFKNQRTYSFNEPRNRLDWALRARFLENKLMAGFRLVDIFNNYMLNRTSVTDNLFQETNWDIQMQTRNFLFSLRYTLFENKGKNRKRKERQYNEAPID